MSRKFIIKVGIRLFSLFIFITVCFMCTAQNVKTIQVSKNGRYLQWSDGVPVYINACTAWSLTRDYSKEEVIAYLDRTVQQKFNTIQISAVFHDVYKGQDIIGPAFSDEDFAKPKSDYWEKVDWVVREAAQRGLIVTINPIWKRQHWKTIQKNGVEKCRAYGKWFAERFKDNPRVLFFVGGDSEPAPVKDELAAMAEGIQEVYNGKAIIAVHCASDSSSLESYTENPSWLTFNWTYAYCPKYKKKYPYQENLENYKNFPTKPFQFAEGYYDFGAAKKYNGSSVNGRWGNRYAVRRQAWWASFLSGSTGQAYGAEAIWHHNRESETWQKALEYDSRKDMKNLMDLVQSLKWWTFKPDTDHSFLVGGYGTYMTDNYALSAISEDKNEAVIYTPVKHTLVLQFKQIHLKHVSMKWFDPTNGTYQKISKKEYKKDGDMLTISSPDANSCGQSDWVLVVKSEK